MGEPLAGISDWKKVALLGQGKASKVYLRVAPHGEPFAIKEIDRAAIVAKGSSETARVVRERDVMRALQHAGLARLRGTDKDDQFLRFVMEPVLGGPLYKHIRAADGGRLEASRSRFYAAEIVSSVAYMHGRGYMHRDLKASNVLLDLRGHVVLVDFGCARKIVEKTAMGGGCRRSRDGSGGSGGGGGGGDGGDGGGKDPVAAGGTSRSPTFCGTPHCMAPEMVRRGGHTFSVDWWAVGVLVYEMLTGEAPFGYGSGASDDAELFNCICGGAAAVVFNPPAFPAPPPSQATLTPHVAAAEAATAAADATPPKSLQKSPRGGEAPSAAAAAALIVALLEVDPARRLGSRCSGSDPGGDEKSCYCYGSGDCSGDSDGGGGCWASDGDAVKAHPWFRKCGDWKAMERRMGEAPPFRRDVGDLDLLAVDCPVVLDVAGKDPFAGF